MDIKGQAAIVTGGASGLGAATARALAAAGAKVAVFDINEAGAMSLAKDVGGIGIGCDVSSADGAKAGIEKAKAAHGAARVLVNCAGIGPAKRIVGRDGPMPLEDFERVIRINLIGTFNMMRLAAADMQTTEPLADGERGVIVSTASVAAFEGQIGQSAYASSKGGVAALTLPAAREFAQFGIRVLAIAPGIFATPMLTSLPQEAQDSLGASVPFPKRLGHPSEYAAMVLHCIAQRLSQWRGHSPRRRAAHGAALKPHGCGMTKESEHIVGLYERRALEWAGDRSQQTNFFEKSWFDRFLALVRPGGTILDIGCGFGKPIAAYVIAQGFDVCGVDSSPTMISLCRRIFPGTMACRPTCGRWLWDGRFDGVIAWDSFFHLTYDDQRRMFPVFRAHAAPSAPLIFTSGPGHGEAIGDLHGEALYHASLDPEEYRALLAANDFDVIDQKSEDPDCGRHTIWLARRDETLG